MVENCRRQHCQMPVNTCLLLTANTDVSIYVIFA